MRHKFGDKNIVFIIELIRNHCHNTLNLAFIV